ncbi:hypothetical protein ACT4S5_01840 [Kocuria oceani]
MVHHRSQLVRQHHGLRYCTGCEG